MSNNLAHVRKLANGPAILLASIAGLAVGSAPASIPFAAEFLASVETPAGPDWRHTAGVFAMSLMAWLLARGLHPFWDMAGVKVVAMDPGGAGPEHMVKGVWLAEAVNTVALSIAIFLASVSITTATLVIIPNIAAPNVVVAIGALTVIVNLFAARDIVKAYNRFDLYANMAMSNYGQAVRLMPGAKPTAAFSNDGLIIEGKPEPVRPSKQ